MAKKLTDILGALKATINDHGPITKTNMGSAAKRIAGQLKPNPRPRLSDEDVVARWRSDIVAPATQDADADLAKYLDEAVWEHVWAGFVIGLGRPDLANYSGYMQLGFPEEC